MAATILCRLSLLNQVDRLRSPGPASLEGYTAYFELGAWERWLTAAVTTGSVASQSGALTPTADVIKRAYLARVQEIGPNRRSSETDDLEHMKKLFPRITRKRVRQLRSKLAPPFWRSPGAK